MRHVVHRLIHVRVHGRARLRGLVGRRVVDRQVLHPVLTLLLDVAEVRVLGERDDALLDEAGCGLQVVGVLLAGLFKGILVLPVGVDQFRNNGLVHGALGLGRVVVCGHGLLAGGNVSVLLAEVLVEHVVVGRSLEQRFVFYCLLFLTRQSVLTGASQERVVVRQIENTLKC